MKDLNYYKENCEEDYLHTPISVLRYITELEKPHVTNDWVTIESNIPPEVCTEVMVKYKDGVKAVAFFDGDRRFYIEKDDIDVSETIVSWHKLP